MRTPLQEFRYRRSMLGLSEDWGTYVPRVVGLWIWLQQQPELQYFIEELLESGRELMLEADGTSRPAARTPDAIHAVGCQLMDLFRREIDHPRGPRAVMEELTRKGFAHPGAIAAERQFITPALDLIEQKLETLFPEPSPPAPTPLADRPHPPEITESLARFQRDHPRPSDCFFIMMRFASTPAHAEIVEGIRATLKPFGLVGLRADDRDYHEDLWPNVRTYMHGCLYGIAVFERLETDDFNPNVSLEVGYMMASKKQVCLLKDKTLRNLPTDLVGKLYKPFDPQKPAESIPEQLSLWLRDKDIITR